MIIVCIAAYFIIYSCLTFVAWIYNLYVKKISVFSIITPLRLIATLLIHSIGLSILLTTGLGFRIRNQHKAMGLYARMQTANFETNRIKIIEFANKNNGHVIPELRDAWGNIISLRVSRDLKFAVIISYGKDNVEHGSEQTSDWVGVLSLDSYKGKWVFGPAEMK